MKLKKDGISKEIQIRKLARDRIFLETKKVQEKEKRNSIGCIDVNNMQSLKQQFREYINSVTGNFEKVKEFSAKREEIISLKKQLDKQYEILATAKLKKESHSETYSQCSASINQEQEDLDSTISNQQETIDNLEESIDFKKSVLQEEEINHYYNITHFLSSDFIKKLTTPKDFSKFAECILSIVAEERIKNKKLALKNTTYSTQIECLKKENIDIIKNFDDYKNQMQSEIAKMEENYQQKQNDLLKEVGL
jgi:hypothetical protein